MEHNGGSGVCVVVLVTLLGAGCQRGTVTPVGAVLLEKDTSAFLTGESRERAARATPAAHSNVVKTGADGEVALKVDTATATDERGGAWITSVKVTVVSNPDYELQADVSDRTMINVGTAEKPAEALRMSITYVRPTWRGTQGGSTMVRLVGDGQIAGM